MNPKTAGHILYCSDDAGFPQLKVAAFSLLDSADTGRRLVIHVFTGGEALTDSHVAELRALIERYPFAELEVTNVEPLFDRYRSALENRSARWVIMTWARIFAGEVLNGVDSIIYMDIDTFVCHDLGALYDLQYGDRMLGAVYEDRRGDGRAEYYWDGIMSGSPIEFYFNAGVLAINLKSFRRENCLQATVDWYARHRETAIRLDQDAFNSLFYDRVIRLHPRYNYSDGWCERQLKCSRRAEYWRGNPPREILEAVLDPWIIHFWGPNKPWRWNHRPEGWRYELALRRLGMLTGALPGSSPWRRLSSYGFAGYHWALRKIASMRI